MLCSSELASCRCALEKDHEGEHGCSCGGEWDSGGNPTTLPQRFEDGSPLPFWPSGMTREEYERPIRSFRRALRE